MPLIIDMNKYRNPKNAPRAGFKNDNISTELKINAHKSHNKNKIPRYSDKELITHFYHWLLSDNPHEQFDSKIIHGYITQPFYKNDNYDKIKHSRKVVK